MTATSVIRSLKGRLIRRRRANTAPGPAVALLGAMSVLWTWAGPVAAGTGLGNEFEHYVNDAFDFHVAIPPDWTCAGCDGAPRGRRPGPGGLAGARSEETWTMTAPEGTTELAAGFVFGSPVNNDEELLALISAQHPDIAWRPFDRGGFVGFSSTDSDTAANAALEYYLVGKQQILRLDWHKDPAMPARAVQLDHVKQSIDRASAPPRVTAVRTERETPYNVGDTACLLVEVDDLRKAFAKDNLEDIRLAGIPDHWSFKSIAWIGEKSWFRVCWAITPVVGPEGLRVLELRIEDNGRRVRCRTETDAPLDLICRGDADPDGRAAEFNRVRQVISPVNNPTPDLSGPELRQLEVAADGRSIRVDAFDPAGLLGAELIIDGQRLVAFGDELGAGRTLSLRPVLREGWNTVEQVVVYDRHGLPTLLRLPADGRGAGATRTMNYESVAWNGTVSPTGLPVVTFFWREDRRP